MLRKMLSGALASICLWGFGLNTLSGEAATVCYTERNSAANSRRQYREQQTQRIQQAPTVNVGYIITGDDAVLLDNDTMGYIRRMLNVKFPGDRYPVKRIDPIEGAETTYEVGRRNNSDKYTLTEAHDVLMQEYELLENIDRNTIKHITVTSPDRREKTEMAEGRNFTTVEMDSRIRPNSRTLFSDQLSQLSKEEYVEMARQANAQGADYDYLVMFNIYFINHQHKEKYVSHTDWSDLCISVKAIDVQSGEYIDRREYLKRGRTNSGKIIIPLLVATKIDLAQRRAMRKAIVNGMIECFDNMPIGKYSVCDNPYCERRQEELRTEGTFGKVNRHCVKHCHDNTNCSDHMVDYTKDADLPSSYVNHRHKVD
ncbi:MAG: hypothetical protein IIV92_06640 [Schwartzia sp.]|nr:hypothetical protein [Schwartzia sp. (in: firmicutes)]